MACQAVLALMAENTPRRGTPGPAYVPVLRTVHVEPPSEVVYKLCESRRHPLDVSKNLSWDAFRALPTEVQVAPPSSVRLRAPPYGRIHALSASTADTATMLESVPASWRDQPDGMGAGPAPSPPVVVLRM